MFEDFISLLISDNKYEIITYQLWLGKYYFSAVPFPKMYLHEFFQTWLDEQPIGGSDIDR